jgi:hypothetical protein
MGKSKIGIKSSILQEHSHGQEWLVFRENINKYSCILFALAFETF